MALSPDMEIGNFFWMAFSYALTALLCHDDMGILPHYEGASLTCILSAMNHSAQTYISHSSKLRKTIVDLQIDLRRLERKYSALYAAIAKKIRLVASNDAQQGT
jgi:hypothetical protein